MYCFKWKGRYVECADFFASNADREVIVDLRNPVALDEKHLSVHSLRSINDSEKNIRTIFFWILRRGLWSLSLTLLWMKVRMRVAWRRNSRKLLNENTNMLRL